MRLSKISCIWKMFCIILYFYIQSSHTHIYTYIHTYMYVNVSDNYLFVPNAVLKSMCMLYPSPSLCYIDALCNWHMNIKRSDEVYNVLGKSVRIENSSYKRHGFQVFGSVRGFCYNVSCAISHLAFLFIVGYIAGWCVDILLFLHSVDR